MTHVQISDATQLQALIDEAEKPLLINFSASWCGPCKNMAPHLEAFAAETPTVTVVKLDVDENKEMAQKFMVRSIPALYVLVDGKVLGTKVGALSKAQLSDFVAKALT